MMPRCLAYGSGYDVVSLTLRVTMGNASAGRLAITFVTRSVSEAAVWGRIYSSLTLRVWMSCSSLTLRVMMSRCLAYASGYDVVSLTLRVTMGNASAGRLAITFVTRSVSEGAVWGRDLFLADASGLDVVFLAYASGYHWAPV